MCRITIGHLRVTIDDLRVIIGHLRVTIGHLGVTKGYLIRAGCQKEGTTVPRGTRHFRICQKLGGTFLPLPPKVANSRRGG